jgi:alkylhydroperoxidase family enzyme
MPKINPVEPENAPEESRALIDKAKQASGGKVVNFHKQMAVSPKSFKGYLDLAGTLRGGTLDSRTQEAIAVGVSNYHGCKY